MPNPTSVTQFVSPIVRGDSPVHRGVVIHERSHLGGGPVYSAADGAVVLGAGWGSTATFAVAASSYDGFGSLTITSSGASQAQATATVTITFKGGAFRAAPRFYVIRNGGTGGATSGTSSVASSTTTASFICPILPVAANTYQYDWTLLPIDEPVT